MRLLEIDARQLGIAVRELEVLGWVELRKSDRLIYKSESG